jgi:hypothetical protein
VGTLREGEHVRTALPKAFGGDHHIGGIERYQEQIREKTTHHEEVVDTSQKLWKFGMPTTRSKLELKKDQRLG